MQYLILFLIKKSSGLLGEMADLKPGAKKVIGEPWTYQKARNLSRNNEVVLKGPKVLKMDRGECYTSV